MHFGPNFNAFIGLLLNMEAHCTPKHNSPKEKANNLARFKTRIRNLDLEDERENSHQLLYFQFSSKIDKIYMCVCVCVCIYIN